jgi:hypothetical protein
MKVSLIGDILLLLVPFAFILGKSCKTNLQTNPFHTRSRMEYDDLILSKLEVSLSNLLV